MLMVIPATEDMAKHLRHPDPGIRAFMDLKTPVAWPNDAFTMRRLADGDIKQVGAIPDQTRKQSGPPLYNRMRYPL